MIYRKNIRQWEQWSRVAGGLALAVWALVTLGGPWGALVAASGAGLAVTGLVGWCPACALAGRRVEDRG